MNALLFTNLSSIGSPLCQCVYSEQLTFIVESLGMSAYLCVCVSTVEINWFSYKKLFGVKPEVDTMIRVPLGYVIRGSE